MKEKTKKRLAKIAAVALSANMALSLAGCALSEDKLQDDDKFPDLRPIDDIANFTDSSNENATSLIEIQDKLIRDLESQLEKAKEEIDRVKELDKAEFDYSNKEDLESKQIEEEVYTNIINIVKLAYGLSSSSIEEVNHAYKLLDNLSIYLQDAYDGNKLTNEQLIKLTNFCDEGKKACAYAVRDMAISNMDKFDSFKIEIGNVNELTGEIQSGSDYLMYANQDVSVEKFTSSIVHNEMINGAYNTNVIYLDGYSIHNGPNYTYGYMNAEEDYYQFGQTNQGGYQQTAREQVETTLNYVFENAVEINYDVESQTVTLRCIGENVPDEFSFTVDRDGDLVQMKSKIDEFVSTFNITPVTEKEFNAFYAQVQAMIKEIENQKKRQDGEREQGTNGRSRAAQTSEAEQGPQM